MWLVTLMIINYTASYTARAWAEKDVRLDGAIFRHRTVFPGRVGQLVGQGPGRGRSAHQAL